MSRPIYEQQPTPRRLAALGFADAQLQRRPGTPGGCCAGPWHYVGEAGEPPFENSVTNAGGGMRTLRFRDSGQESVDVEGVVVTGGSSPPLVVTTIPATFPLPDESIPLPGTGTVGASAWQLDPDGSLWLISGAVTTSELDYVEGGGANVTATSEATATTIITANAVTYDGATKTKIEFSFPIVILPSPAAAQLLLVLYDGAGSIGKLGAWQNGAAGGQTILGIYGARYLTPSAASHTYSIRAFVTSTTGTPAIQDQSGGSGSFMPSFIRQSLAT